MRKLFAAVAVAALAAGSPFGAQAQADRGGAGLMLGIGATYTPAFDFTIQLPEEEGGPIGLDVDGGVGVAVRAGFGFTPVFVVFAGYEQSWHDVPLEDGAIDGRLEHLFGGLRINLPVAPSLAPYVSAGFGRRNLRLEEGGESLRLSGNFTDIGGGIQIFAGRSLTFDLGANYSFGEFGKATFSGDGGGDDSADIDTNNVGNFRIRVGLTWLPMTRR